MNAFHFLETKWEFIFDIHGSIRVVCQLHVVVVTVFSLFATNGQVPLQTRFLPFVIPFELGAGPYEKLKFHLFELAHTHDELPSNDFVAECFPDLSDAEGYLHPPTLLYIQKVNENTLCSLRSQI